MASKYTIDIVRREFDDRDLILKSTEYICMKQRLKYECKKGHSHTITFREFKQGAGCRTCTRERMAAAKRLKIGFIRSKFAEKGCILRSEKYIGCNSLLDYTCPRGHEHKISWSNFKLGYGCPICDAEDKKHDVEYIRNEVEKRGWVFRSDKYTGSHDKFDYTCDKGHDGSMTWNNFSNGAGCMLCYKENNFGENATNWKGGISCDPYCDAWADKEYKESIRERDGYKCQNPYCKCNNGVISIHHIDYNKINCHPSNLITVCRSCNSMANGDREWHTAWYQTFMNKKYNYTYNQV